MSAEQPLYQHDSSCCVFLGVFDAHDLYFCKQGTFAAEGFPGNRPTVIARYGDDGPEYLSGMAFARKDVHLQLFEAKERAISRGLISREEADALVAEGPVHNLRSSRGS